MPDDAKKPPIFQAAQPSIPGVPARSGEKAAQPGTKKQPPYFWAAGGAGIVVVVIALAWWAHGVKRTTQAAPVAAPPVSVAHAAARPAEALPVAPGKIATVAQLEEPWSSRKFVYRYSNGDSFPAMVVHLHGTTYWAFSLKELYGTCELELAGVEKLRDYYEVSSKYPMVGDPCTRTVYDLTRYSPGPNGLVRGAIVAGTGGRPPLAIEVEVQGDKIIASRSE